MSKLVKPLLVVSLIGTLVCLALGLLINGQKTQYLNQLTEVEKGLKSMPDLLEYNADFRKDPREPALSIQRIRETMETTSQELANKTSGLSNMQNKLATEIAEKEKIGIDLESTQKDLEAAKNELSQAKEKYSTLKRDSDGVNQELKGWKPQELFDRIAELEASSKNLDKQVKALEAQALELQTKLESPQNKIDSAAAAQAPGGLSGKVVAVNKPWSFVVVNLGKNDQLAEGVEMTVSRENSVVGKVRTVSVDAATAVADILPNSGDIQVGDQVSY